MDDYRALLTEERCRAHFMRSCAQSPFTVILHHFGEDAALWLFQHVARGNNSKNMSLSDGESGKSMVINLCRPPYALNSFDMVDLRLPPYW